MTAAPAWRWRDRCAVGAPAALALAASAWLAIGCPEPESWRAAWLDPANRHRWAGWLDFADEPNWIAGRALWLAALETGADLRWLALLPWAAALATVWLVARQLRRGGASAGLLLALAAAFFSPAFGANWLLAERARALLPALAATLAALCLARAPDRRAPVWAAMALALLALGTHTTGAGVWVGLLPLVAWRAAQGGRPVLPALAGWSLIGATAALCCYDTPVASTPRIQRPVLDAPLAVAEHVARVAGLPLPAPVIAAPVAVGASLLACLVLVTATTARGSRWRQRSVALGLGLAGCGAAQAAVIGVSHFPPVLAPPLLRGIAWGGLLLPVGLLLALPSPPQGPRAKVARGLGVVAALALIAADWFQGLTQLQNEHRFLRQQEALSVFAAVEGLPVPPPVPLEVARHLQARGVLRRAAPLPDLAVDQLRLDPRPAGRCAATAGLLAGVLDDGGGAPRAALVVVAHRGANAPATVVRVATPDPAAVDPRPWTVPLTGGAFADGDSLAAFAFYLDDRSLRPLPPVHRIRDGQPVAEPDAHPTGEAGR